jgi:hypothetical protein
MKYAIKAIFEPAPLPTQYTLYEEVLFDTEEEAVDALNGEYGETLSQAATIDTQNDPDLSDYYLSDLIVYKVGE